MSTAQDTRYQVDGRGDFYTDEFGVVVHVETHWGGKGSLNPDLRHPLPDATYVVHRESVRYVYTTDSQSRTVLAVTDDYRPLDGGERSSYTQTRIGRLGGGGYDGGHLIPIRAGAGGEAIGTVPMHNSINRGGGRYWQVEKYLHDAWVQLQKTNPGAKIEYEAAAVYTGTSKVPSSFNVRFRLPGQGWVEEGITNG